MKKLYFIRHGLSEMNLAGLVAGSTETPLTDEGRKQASAAAQHAKELGIDLIVASPLSRALDTAKIIAKEINYPSRNIVINPLFIERHFGELEGKVWAPDVDIDGFSDIETDDTVLERAHLALSWLRNRSEDHILVVSHGGFGRAIRHHILEDHPFSDRSKHIMNAEIVQWI